MKSNVLFGVISFEASIKLLKMFPVHTSIKSPPEGTLGFTPIHTQREKIYTMVRAYKAAKKKKKSTPSMKGWVSMVGRKEKKARGKVGGCILPASPSLLLLLQKYYQRGVWYPPHTTQH